MSFPPQFLDEIRAHHPLSEFVGRRLRLTRRGHEFSGLCPFHNEKTPSFTVNDSKGFFHCFGCGAHGDVIGFVMRMDSLPFGEAVERLAEAANLPLPARDRGWEEKAVARASLYDVLEAATVWFEAALRAPEGRPARAYLAARGVDGKIAKRFRLGWAPESSGGLKAALAGKGILIDLMVTGGLLVTPENGGAPYDRFRGRLIFPIMDQRNRVIAFGGRLLGEGRPKYLNSPETPLFHKGAVLYGLSLAGQDARRAGTILVAEGYMDVIGLYRAGIANAVAPLGTALTEIQVETLWRLAPEPILCLDGDEAGQSAAQRAAERTLPRLRPGCSLRFATLPPGEDPDSLVTRDGAEAFHALCASAVPLVDFLWRQLVGGRSLDTPERKAGVKRDLGNLARRISDNSVRAYYESEFRSRLYELFRGAAPRQAAGSRPGKWFGRASGATARAALEPPIENSLGTGTAGSPIPREKSLMQTLLNFPSLIPEVSDQLADRQLRCRGYASILPVMIESADRMLAENGQVDTRGMSYAYVESGLSAIVDELVGRDAQYHLGWAADPSTHPADARLQLLDTLNLCKREWTEKDKDTAERALLEDGSVENRHRFNAAVQRWLEAKERTIDDADYGVASGRPRV